MRVPSNGALLWHPVQAFDIFQFKLMFPRVAFVVLPSLKHGVNFPRPIQQYGAARLGCRPAPAPHCGNLPAALLRGT